MRYANALFELAVEQDSLDSIAADIDAFGGLLEESPDLVRLVRSPVFSTEEQSRALGAVLGKAGIGGMVRNFVALVAANRRAFALRDMVRGFRQLVAAHRGEATADVASAEALSDKQVESLKAALKSVVGKDVSLNATVDPSLIGGLVVKMGSRMIDTSLKTKLNSLRIAMKEVG